jgi:hypothetical protein
MTDLWDVLRGALTTKALAAVVDAGVPAASVSEAPFPHRFGARFWEWLAEHPAERLAGLEWREGEIVVDVGRGNDLLASAGFRVESLENPIVATCR